MKKIKWILLAALVMVLMPKMGTEAAARVFDVIVKDGYSTQTISMLYGETPYGYTSYFAEQSVILVNPKAKTVRFSIKNENSRYSNFSFQSKKLKVTDSVQYNMLNYSADGRTRAFMFSVRKTEAPTGKNITFTQNKKKTTRLKAEKGKSIAIRWAVDYDVAPSMKIEILDKSGKVVYKKEYAKAKNYQSCMLKWNGKPSKGNEAGLSTKNYVPAGKYTLKLTLTSKVKKKKLISETTKTFRIVKSTKSA